MVDNRRIRRASAGASLLTASVPNTAESTPATPKTGSPAPTTPSDSCEQPQNAQTPTAPSDSCKQPQNAQAPTAPSDSCKQPQHAQEFRVYRRRWIVLAVVAVLASSNSMLWIAFAAVDNHATAFYHSKASLFAMVYLVFTVPSGALAMSMDRRIGLKGSLMIAAWTNLTGATLRFISSFLSKSLRFPCGLIGQVLAAWAYPFIMFLPTKVANTWFAPNERAIATTITTMSNPLGVFAANIMSPLIVTKAAHVRILNGILFVPPLMACIAATVGLTESQPKIPPSFSAAHAQMGFCAGLKKCLTSKSYLLLLLTMGGGNAMFTSVYSIIHILLCPSGYSNRFVGFCGALMIGCGIVGAMVSGVIASRTKWYEQIMKVSVALTALSFILFLQLTLHPHMEWPMALAAASFGIFGLAAYPVGLELAAECTFPASQTTSMGLVVISGQAFAVVLLQVVRMTARRLQYDRMGMQSCTTDEAKTIIPFDNTFPVLIMSAVGTIVVLMFFGLYRPNYRRSILERRNLKQAAAAIQRPTNEQDALNEVNVDMDDLQK